MHFPVPNPQGLDGSGPTNPVTTRRRTVTSRSGIAACALLFGAFLLGVWVGLYKWPPFHVIQKVRHSLQTWVPPLGPPPAVQEPGLNTTTLNCLEVDGRVVFGRYSMRLMTEEVPFPVRDGAGAITIDDSIYLIGGWNLDDKDHFPRITSNDVWVSQDLGQTWENLKPNTYDQSFRSGTDWEGRHCAGYVTLNRWMYIVGGDANQGYHINDVWRSRDGIRWELVNANPPWSPRALHLTFTYRDKMYVVGGQTMPRFLRSQDVNEIYYRDVWESQDGIEWKKVGLQGDLFSPRGGYGGSGFVLNDEVFIVGGFSYEGLVNCGRVVQKDIWKSSKDLSRWELVGELPMGDDGKGIMYHDTATFDGALWVIGGASVGIGNTNTIWFTYNGVDWNRVPRSPLSPTHATSVWSTPRGIVIAAGNGWSKQVWLIERSDAGVPLNEPSHPAVVPSARAPSDPK